MDEPDLLRASGALHKLGIDLGVYRSRGIDCPEARFCFTGMPEYRCPVEIEESSKGFRAPHHQSHRAERVVVLCMRHDEPTVLQGYVDVFEVKELDRILGKSA